MPSLEPGEDAPRPAQKRQKLLKRREDQRSPGSSNSRLFAAYRTIGLVSPTAVPFTTVAKGKTTFQITTCIGRSLQTYDLRRGLSLLFVTRPQTPWPITATTAWQDHVLAAWGGQHGQESGIWVYQRGKVVDRLQMPKERAEQIDSLMIFGAWIVGCAASRIEVWQASTLEHYATLISPYAGSAGQEKFYRGGICNMPTFLNKVFAGRYDGGIEIWNISTGRLLYTLLPPTADYGSVTALQPTPALSLLAVAHANGAVSIRDVQRDETVLEFSQAGTATSPISTISFRTDGLGAGDDGRVDGVMATACQQTGNVTIWDLNEGGRKMGTLYGAHNQPSQRGKKVPGGVSKIEFLAGQAVMVTTGLDNALKTWIFDEVPFSAIPRPLHSRGGHGAPVSTMQFLPSESDGSDAFGKWLLSGSQDRSLWAWSLRRDGQSSEISQGHVRKKARKKGLLNGEAVGTGSLEDLKVPRITCMASSLNRDGGMGTLPGAQAIWTNARSIKGNKDTSISYSTGWESIITGHEGEKVARTWFWGRKRAGRWSLETGDGGIVTSVAMSPCGTFGLVGSSLGGLDMFNLESGLLRQRFPPRVSQKTADHLKNQPAPLSKESPRYSLGQGKHTKSVTGIAVSSLNDTIISGGADGRIKFWNTMTGLLEHDIDWSSKFSILRLDLHRASDLIAVVCSDGAVRMLDATTRKVVRDLQVPPPLQSHTDHNTPIILDMTFSPSARWLTVSTASSCLLTWDLPTTHLIDAFRLPSPATSIAISPTEEYLATAHPDSVGISIWTNRTLFSVASINRIRPDDITRLGTTALPTAAGDSSASALATAMDAIARNTKPVFDNGEDDHVSSSMTESQLESVTDDLTTLSLIPRPHILTLRHIDDVRKRNKPIEPPKKPEKAPFFLPSLPELSSAPSQPSQANGLSTTASNALPPAAARSAESTSSRFLTASFRANGSSTSPSITADPTALVAHLSSLPPSQADFFISSLDGRAPFTELTLFVRAMTARLRERRDFEAVQVWMSRFLDVWAEAIVEAREGGSGVGTEDADDEGEWEGLSDENDGDKTNGEAVMSGLYSSNSDGEGDLIAALKIWKVAQEQESAKLDELVGYCRGVLGYLRGF